MSLKDRIASWLGKEAAAAPGSEEPPDPRPDEAAPVVSPAAGPATTEASGAIATGPASLFECAIVPKSGPRCVELIEAGHDPLERDSEGRTPIHAAAIHGNLEALAVFCEHAIGVDPLDNQRVSPLLYALRSGDPKAAEAAAFLLKKGAKVTLNVAYCMGDLHLINHLHTSNRHAFKECKCPDDLLTDLVNAIRRKCDEKIAMAGCGGEDARIEAIEAEVIEPYLPIIIRTVDMGCHPDAFDTAGRPALFLTLHFRCPLLAETFLKQGADPAFETEAGETPLRAASGDPRMEALLQQYCNDG